MDSRERFTPTVEDYAAYRPAYPDALLDWIAEATDVHPPAVVADLGAGTGIASRQLAARGYRVTGIEPNAAMLARAEHEGGGPAYRHGEAAATGLAAGSVDLVTAAQAFHWFDVPATMAETRRILRPGGWAAAFWNIRASTPFLLAYEACLQAFSDREPRAKDVPPTRASLAAIRAAAAVANAREAEFPNRQRLDRAGLFGRARSASYVHHAISRREEFERELGGLFARFAHDGYVEFVYQAAGICWQLP